MTIHIEDLTCHVIIGLLDFERDRPQKVIVNMQIDYLYSEDNFINYADVVQAVQEQLKTRRYILLENALIGIKSLLFATYPKMQTLTLKISKPDILEECSVAVSNHWIF